MIHNICMAPYSVGDEAIDIAWGSFPIVIAIVCVLIFIGFYLCFEIFIYIQCLWKEEPCEESDFQHKLTHLGNCYSFNLQGENSDEADWKHSYSAGAGK